MCSHDCHNCHNRCHCHCDCHLITISFDSCQVVASVQLVDECGCKHLCNIAKRELRAQTFHFHLFYLGILSQKIRYCFVKIHSVGLEILCDEFLGHILSEKCRFAAAIDGRVPLNFEP